MERKRENGQACEIVDNETRPAMVPSVALVPVKPAANYNERTPRMYFGKWEQKDTTGQKFASRARARTHQCAA